MTAAQVAHSERFRRVSNRYPRRVAEAYGRDLAAAAADSDDAVAARVAEWERANGLEPRDWATLGRDDEGKGQDRADRAWANLKEAFDVWEAADSDLR